MQKILFRLLKIGFGGGIVNGMGDNTFAPKEKTTRAQAAKVIYKAMEVVGR